MRNDGHRHAVLCKALHNLEHFADHLRVERGGRLVEQHHIGMHAQRAHNSDALLLPAGKLGRVGARPVG